MAIPPTVARGACRPLGPPTQHACRPADASATRLEIHAADSALLLPPRRRGIFKAPERGGGGKVMQARFRTSCPPARRGHWRPYGARARPVSPSEDGPVGQPWPSPGSPALLINISVCPNEYCARHNEANFLLTWTMGFMLPALG